MSKLIINGVETLPGKKIKLTEFKSKIEIQNLIKEKSEEQRKSEKYSVEE
jgi:hypothetical protein